MIVSVSLKTQKTRFEKNSFKVCDIIFWYKKAFQSVYLLKFKVKIESITHALENNYKFTELRLKI